MGKTRVRPSGIQVTASNLLSRTERIKKPGAIAGLLFFTILYRKLSLQGCD